jgi:hypothetical protein
MDENKNEKKVRLLKEFDQLLSIGVRLQMLGLSNDTINEWRDRKQAELRDIFDEEEKLAALPQKFTEAIEPESVITPPRKTIPADLTLAQIRVGLRQAEEREIELFFKAYREKRSVRTLEERLAGIKGLHAENVEYGFTSKETTKKILNGRWVKNKRGKKLYYNWDKTPNKK